MLQEYLISDDGENTFPSTMFQDLTQVPKKKYRIQNSEKKYHIQNFTCTSRDMQK